MGRSVKLKIGSKQDEANILQDVANVLRDKAIVLQDVENVLQDVANILQDAANNTSFDWLFMVYWVFFSSVLATIF